LEQTAERFWSFCRQKESRCI